MASVSLDEYLGREYDVECDGEVVKLKPMKAWILAPFSLKCMGRYLRKVNVYIYLIRKLIYEMLNFGFRLYCY